MCKMPRQAFCCEFFFWRFFGMRHPHFVRVGACSRRALPEVRNSRRILESGGFLCCILFLGVAWGGLICVSLSLLCSGSWTFSPQKTVFLKNRRIVALMLRTNSLILCAGCKRNNFRGSLHCFERGKKPGRRREKKTKCENRKKIEFFQNLEKLWRRNLSKIPDCNKVQDYEVV